MPQQSDALEDLIDAPHRRALRSLFLDYEVTMISCLYWRNRAPWHLPERRVADSFLLFPVKGELRVALPAGEARVRVGEFLMLPEGVPHELELTGGFERLEQISLHCHIHDRWGRPFLSRLPTSVGALPGRLDWNHMLRELTCVMTHDPELGQQRGAAMVRELLAWQLSKYPALVEDDTSGDARVRTVIEAMERNLDSSEMSVESLARSVRITATQLRTLFRQETGESPRRFLIKLRLRRAVSLLRHSAVSVKEVAAACGFTSDHYFHLVFRQAFGRTPSQFREHTAGEI